MKQYKLIKKYPGCPDIGYITKPKFEGETEHYWMGTWFNPQDFPEFWEEVIPVVYYKLTKQTPNNNWRDKDNFPMKIGVIIPSDEAIKGHPLYYWVKGQEQFWEIVSKEDYEAQFIPDYTGVCYKDSCGRLFKVG